MQLNTSNASERLSKKRLISVVHLKFWIYSTVQVCDCTSFLLKREQNMASYICGLSLFSAFLSFLVASISEYYEANLEFDNKVPTLEPMHSKYAESSVICAMLCGSGCKCFNFNEHTRMCQSYNSCNILDNTVNEIGWRLYVKRSLSRNGEFEVFANTIPYSILIIVLWLYMA